MNTAQQEKTASHAQVSFIGDLIKSRIVPAELLAAACDVPLSAKAASVVIDKLTACTHKSAMLGYYHTGGATYVVVATKDGMRRYAKKLVFHGKKATWVYAPGAMANLAQLSPLTLAEAAALGHAHGHCIVCGAELTVTKSVQAGIGPKCAKKFA
jgi:hypothetical protein